MKVILENIEFEVLIERKRIKNMYLRVRLDNTLFVTAHPSVPLEQVQAFIASKEEWILSTLKKVTEREIQNRKGVNGPILYFLGEKKFVRYEISKRSYVLLDDDMITFHVPEINDKEIVKAFNNFAKPYLMKILDIQRVRWDRIMEMYHVQLPSIKIRSMTSKWGSCMVDKAEITMNLSLVHYSLASIDYVLWHEYVHLIVPNHSKRFYDLLSHHMPDFKKAKDALV